MLPRLIGHVTPPKRLNAEISALTPASRPEEQIYLFVSVGFNSLEIMRTSQNVFLNILGKVATLNS